MSKKKILIGALLAVVMVTNSMVSTSTVFAKTINSREVLIEDTKEQGLQIYVSEDGDDSNRGTLEEPFKTFNGARDYIRGLKGNNSIPENGIAVNIRGGAYVLTESFELTKEDSGTKDAPIIYRAYEDEEVSIKGGYSLDGSKFTSVTDDTVVKRLPEGSRNEIKQINVKEQGISEYGEMTKNGFGWETLPPAPELLIDNKAMTISRYPNEGFLKTGSVVRQGFVPRDHESDSDMKLPPHDCPPREEWINQDGPIFKYTDDKLDKWSEEDDIWLFGYWKWDWADDNLNVTIDTEKNEFTAEHPSRYGIVAGARYYAYNLLSEIDMPGEWYLDRSSGMLYIYPKEDLTNSKIELTILDKPLVNMNEASNIKFENITFEVSRGSGIKMMNGEDNLIADCTFRTLGKKAVEIGEIDKGFNGTMLIDSESGGGRNNGVVACDIYDTGAGGISIIGGNRENLEPANNYAHNNKISNYARLIRTYKPAIDIAGVGNSATNNLISDGPHIAIQFRGNDLVIEGNEIFNVCYETADSGVIYSARDWSYRGNKINNNFIHDITTLGGLGSYAIYLDDLMSSAEIKNNVFYNIGNYSFLIGGGRDNVIENNMLINSKNTIHADNRGQGWASYHAEAPNGTNYKALMNVPYDTGIWAERYPKLVAMWDKSKDNKTNSDEAKIPRGNRFKNNLSLGSGGSNIASVIKTTGEVEEPSKIDDIGDIGFIDTSGLNFQLKEGSPVFEKHPEFKNINFDTIGLLNDEYRTKENVVIGDVNIVSPANGEKDLEALDVKFTWEKATNAKQYEFVIAEDRDFTKIVSKDVVKGTSINKKLNENKTYYWKVIGKSDSYSLMGTKESEVFSFTTKDKNYNMESSFEDGIGRFSIQKGTPTFSNEKARTGEKSYKVDQDMDVIGMKFDQNINGVVSVWYYDNMQQNTNQVANAADNVTGSVSLGILTDRVKDKYVYRIGNVISTSNVKRVAGWHEFKWDYSSGKGVDLYIDNTKVASSDIVKSFSKFEMGDFWQGIGNSIGYFDDFKIEHKKAYDIVSINTEVKNLEVDYGTEFNSLNLPAEVDVTVKNLDGNESKSTVRVEWNSENYDEKVPGTYSVEGKLKPNFNTNNTGELSITVNVRVKPEIIGDVSKVDELENFIIEVGEGSDEINLPTEIKVTIQLRNGGTEERVLPVKWLLDGYDWNIPGVYEVVGEIVVDETFTNKNEIKANATIYVLEGKIVVSKPEKFKPEEITENSVTLYLDEPNNTIGLDGYLLYKDGDLIAEIDKGTRTYTVKELTKKTVYKFEVASKYINGEISKGKSISVNVK